MILPLTMSIRINPGAFGNPFNAVEPGGARYFNV